SRIDAIGTWYQEKMATGWPPVPHWIATLPLVGPRIEHFWTGLGSGDPAAVAKARELGGLLIALLLKVAAALGQGLLLVVLSLVFALFFYVGGEPLSRWLYALASRIGGAQGRELLDVAGETVIAVVYGIGGTALVQGTLAFLGYWIAGVPYALSFGLVSGVLALVPDGQALIGLPLAVWLYQQGQTGWALFLAVWMLGLLVILAITLAPVASWSADEAAPKGPPSESASEPQESERRPLRELLYGATPEERERLAEERKRLSAAAAAFGTDPTAIIGYYQLTYGHSAFTNNLRLESATAVVQVPLTPNWFVRATLPYLWADSNQPMGSTTDGSSDT